MASPDNLPLRDLQKLILGKRCEPLSDIEIRNLFSYPTTPESILYIITALNKDKIDTNTVLVQSITNSVTQDDLIPIALSLRYDADPNLYVKVPNIGNIHILAYVYMALSSKGNAILNSSVIMLTAMGSNPNNLVFETKSCAPRDEYSLVEPIKGQTVLDWLEDQGYDTILYQIKGRNYDDVEDTFMTTLGTYLDRSDLLKSLPNPDEVIQAHTNNIKLDVNSYDGLKLSVKYLNLTTYEEYVDAGAELTYSDTNDIITSINKYTELGDIISKTQSKNMFIYSLARGLELDSCQASMIDKNLLCKIKGIFFQPYWLKACVVLKGKVNNKLQLLAYQLNINPEISKDVLCHRIKNIMKSDPCLIKYSIIERQKSRIRSDVAYINEFGDLDCPLPPDIECLNNSLVENLYDYPDSDIAYYRDFQDTLWCFTSNNYIKMLDRNVNPYTNVPFPKSFTVKVQKQLDYISLYRDIEEDAIPMSTIIDSMYLEDEPNDLMTNRYVKSFKTLLAENQIVNIDKISSNDLETVLLEQFGIITNLTDLSRSHALKTFYIVSYINLDNSSTYFKTIQNLLNSSPDNNIEDNTNQDNIDQDNIEDNQDQDNIDQDNNIDIEL